MSVTDEAPGIPTPYTPPRPLAPLEFFPVPDLSFLQVRTCTMRVMGLPLPHWIRWPVGGDSLESAKRSMQGIQTAGEQAAARAEMASPTHHGQGGWLAAAVQNLRASVFFSTKRRGPGNFLVFVGNLMDEKAVCDPERLPRAELGLRSTLESQGGLTGGWPGWGMA